MPDPLKPLRALADPTRLRIIVLLGQEELAVTELQEITRLGQSRISTHLGLLQEAGIDAGPVEDFADVHDDPQLAHRGHFRPVTHAVLGTYPAETDALRFSDTAPRFRSGAPLLGEHTEHVLRDLLGMPATEFVALRGAGVLE